MTRRRRVSDPPPRDPWEGREKPNQAEVDLLLALLASLCLIAIPLLGLAAR